MVVPRWLWLMFTFFNELGKKTLPIILIKKKFQNEQTMASEEVTKGTYIDYDKSINNTSLTTTLPEEYQQQ